MKERIEKAEKLAKLLNMAQDVAQNLENMTREPEILGIVDSIISDLDDLGNSADKLLSALESA